MVACSDPSSDFIQAPHHAQKVLQAHTSPWLAGSTAVSFAQQRIQSTLCQYNSDISMRYKHKFSKPCTLQTKMFSLAPQQVVARRSTWNLPCCGYGVNWNNWELSALSPTRKWLIFMLRSGHQNSENSKEERRLLALLARPAPIYIF